jgi:hypothetical protein
MRSMKKTLILPPTFVLAFGLAPLASAQDPVPQQPRPQEQAPAAPQAQPAQDEASQTAEGELLNVDMDEQTLTIKKADGKEVTFSYNDETEISGAQREVAGLATVAGSNVTVTYETEGDTHTATKIEVKAKDKSYQ